MTYKTDIGINTKNKQGLIHKIKSSNTIFNKITEKFFYDKKFDLDKKLKKINAKNSHEIRMAIDGLIIGDRKIELYGNDLFSYFRVVNTPMGGIGPKIHITAPIQEEPKRTEYVVYALKHLINGIYREGITASFKSANVALFEYNEVDNHVSLPRQVGKDITIYTKSQRDFEALRPYLEYISKMLEKKSDKKRNSFMQEYGVSETANIGNEISIDEFVSFAIRGHDGRTIYVRDRSMEILRNNIAEFDHKFIDYVQKNVSDENIAKKSLARFRHVTKDLDRKCHLQATDEDLRYGDRSIHELINFLYIEGLIS